MSELEEVLKSSVLILIANKSIPKTFWDETIAPILKQHIVEHDKDEITWDWLVQMGFEQMVDIGWPDALRMKINDKFSLEMWPEFKDRVLGDIRWLINRKNADDCYLPRELKPRNRGQVVRLVRLLMEA